MAEEQAPVKTEEPVASKKAAKKQMSTKKIIAIVVGVVVAIIVVIFIVASMATSGPKKVANSLISDIQSKNSTAAYNLLSSEAKTTIPQDQFKQVVDQIGPILNGKPQSQSSETSGETGKAATAKAVYLIKGSNGITYRFTVNLTKENGEWKVANFESTDNANK